MSRLVVFPDGILCSGTVVLPDGRGVCNPGTGTA